MAKEKKQKTNLQKYKEEHKKKGLCVYCNKKVIKGKTMCRYHLDYHKFRKMFLGKKKGANKK